ncbi:hypothetical protein MATL_G00073530 [Megalops atlanticus]|uniref:Apoptosis facilitator Bcl-2-like protein 14 n=1 Tax=Megalops atlanticus TaxID=7932 RepID=A0A9D3Q896_MEGAT|nr:hypothetical protein MATL_G00073530 [Megalops atlanticus]
MITTKCSSLQKGASSMQSTDSNAAHQPQLLSLGHKDTTRLLEVYVKRSLSLNDGPAAGRRTRAKPHKRVTLAEKNNRVRRHSSDSSAHLSPREVESVVTAFEPAPVEGPADVAATADLPEEAPETANLESSTEEEQKKPKKGSKKSKKPSFLKSILNLFSRKGTDKKEERQSSSPERAGTFIPPDTPSPTIFCLPVPATSSGSDQSVPGSRRSLRRKSTLKRFSFRAHRGEDGKNRIQRPTTLGLRSDAVSLEPNVLYYEKMSEELEKIVKEVKDSPTDEGHKNIVQNPEPLRQAATPEAEVIERFVTLIKQQGDAIDVKLKENSNVNSFFQKLSYGSFQQLADLYVESETPGQLPEGKATAPELVKFAFTLDFTAKVAGLSSQTLGRIMGFGNQYLQDRFTHMSVNQSQDSQSQPTQNFSGPD